MTIRLDVAALRLLEDGRSRVVGESIWRDPYVQRQLLAAHLDPSHDAATRVPGTVAGTLAWLVSGLEPGAAILDLGCGPGLYVQPLADRGFAVTGVDFNAAALDYARARAAGTVRYVLADYTQHMPDGPFDLIVLIYLDFGTHRPTVQRDLLTSIRARLRPGGRFVFDFLDAQAAGEHHEDRTWQASTAGGFWSPDPYLLLTQTVVDRDQLALCTQYTVVTEAGIRHFDVWEHCFTDDTVRGMLTEAGFCDVDLHRGVLPPTDAHRDPLFAVATA